MNQFNPNQRPVPPMGWPQLGFMEALKICLKEKYCCFEGRARRSEFWWYALAAIILNTVLSGITIVNFFSNGLDINPNDPFAVQKAMYSSPAGIISIIVSIALLLPSLGVQVRRLHDIGKSGWWVLLDLLAMVPIINFVVAIILLVFFSKDSQRDENEYGPSPKYQ